MRLVPHMVLRRPRRVLAVAVLALAGLPACVSSGAGAVGQVAGGDSVLDPVGAFDAAAVRCPATQPAEGSPCTGGATCTFGDGAGGLGCRARATCVGDAWQTSPAACPLPTRRCAAPWPRLQGSPCDLSAAACGDTGVPCRCLPACAPGAGPARAATAAAIWRCDAPTATPNCPGYTPNPGAVCAPEGQRCRYGGCTFACLEGAWQAPACGASAR